MPTTAITKPDVIAAQEAERCALSCAMIDPFAAWPVVNTLEPQDFFDPRNRQCFEAVRGVWEREHTIDFINITEVLRNRTAPQALIDYLSDTFTYTPSAYRVNEYVEIVKDRARRRRILDGLSGLVRTLYDTERPLIEAIEQGQQALADQLPPDTGGATALQGAQSVLAKLQYYYSNPIGQYDTRGIDTGYRLLNAAIDGWKRGNVYYVLGLEHSGKTTMALNFAMNVCKAGGHVAVYSLEQSTSASEDPQQSSLWERLVLSQAGLTTRAYQMGRLSSAEYDNVLEAGDAVAAWALTMHDDKHSIPEIEASIQRLQHERPLDLVVIDYLKLLEPQGATGSRNEQIGELTGRLKRLALRQRIPLIVPQQVGSKSIAVRQNKRVQLSDGYESGHISQDADAVLGFNRPELFDPNTENPNMIELDVLKDRISAGTGYSIPLYFNRHTGLILNVYSAGQEQPAEEHLAYSDN